MSLFQFIRVCLITGALITGALVGLELKTHPEFKSLLLRAGDQIKNQVLVLKNIKKDRLKIAGEMEAEAVKWLDSRTLQVRTKEGVLYHFRLAGIQPARAGSGLKSVEKAELDAFMNSALSESVLVQFTHTNLNRTGFGLVFLGNTNLSVELCRNGWYIPDPSQKDLLPTSDWNRINEASR